MYYYNHYIIIIIFTKGINSVNPKVWKKFLHIFLEVILKV